MTIANDEKETSVRTQEELRRERDTALETAETAKELVERARAEARVALETATGLQVPSTRRGNVNF